MRFAGTVERMWEYRNVYRIFGGKSEGKRPLERKTRRWEENFKMAFQELVEEDVGSMNLAQDWNR